MPFFPGDAAPTERVGVDVVATGYCSSGDLNSPVQFFSWPSRWPEALPNLFDCNVILPPPTVTPAGTFTEVSLPFLMLVFHAVLSTVRLPVFLSAWKRADLFPNPMS